MSRFPALIEEVTAEWLSGALGVTVLSFSARQVGTGQIGTCYQLTLQADNGSKRVIAKLPAVDPAARALLAGSYRSEVRFYRDLVPMVKVRAPLCYHVDSSENGDFVLLLEDLDPAQQGDQLAGCTLQQAHDAVVNLAGLHGPSWCDPRLLQLDGLSINGPEDAAMLAEFYGPANDIFIERVGDRLSPADNETLRQIPSIVERWALARAEKFALVHGDYRIDNLLFPPSGRRGVHTVDWQTLSLALPARDLAYFISTSLEPYERRAHERDLVASYHGALGSAVTASYTYDECWQDYRFAMIQGPLICVFGLAYGTRTERGDRMFAVMASRACAAIRDLGTLQCI